LITTRRVQERAAEVEDLKPRALEARQILAAMDETTIRSDEPGATTIPAAAYGDH